MIDNNETIALKDAMTIASPFIKSLVENLVVPKIKKISENFQSKKNVYIPTEENFVEYYHRTFKKLAVINTLVFKNTQRFLKDIYLPLTLVSGKNDNLRVKVTKFPEQISNKYHNILITDTAGMGKSTLMKKLFLDSIFQNLGIPIFIELRRLNRNKSIIQEIQEELSSLQKRFDSDLLMEILSDGGFIIILDGYDEIPLKDRDIVTQDLQQFISKANNNRFFITSRPENALASFGNFYEFTIQPLIKKEAFELLRKYDNRGEVSKLLIKKLEESDMQNIKEFLVNPLLVSLLFTAFEHKQAVPFKKYLFYRQVYDANFEAHDLTKGDSYIHDKYSDLEIDDFHSVLRHIGYSCLQKQKIEFSKDEILKLIGDAKTFCTGIDFKESDFLQDILRTVPLFTKDGNYYKWSHKSLQEYFAAQFIYLDSKTKQEDILSRIYNHKDLDKFINVLDLYYDMDYKTFQNLIEYNFLKDYMIYNEQFYNYEYPNVSASAIRNRREIMYLYNSFIFRASRNEKGRYFGDEKLSEMFKKCEEKHNLDANFNGVIDNFEKNEDIFCVHNDFVKSALIPLFANKKNNIVQSYTKGAKNTHSLSFDIPEEYDAIIISDDPTESFNLKENFQSITELIKITRTNNWCINNEEAFIKLDIITAEIEREASNKDELDNF